MNLFDQKSLLEEVVCPDCERAREMPYVGWYNFSCLHCCARYVLAMPDDWRIFEAYEIFKRRNHAPSVERIKAEVERMQALNGVE